MSLKALRITGEVITTPFSFVATSHALLWNGLRPVFVDIDAKTLNIDPRKIEAAITSSTTAILPVHCYGRPCNFDEIQRIADEYNLRVIYDAAHSFGVNCHCGSPLNHGDLSILSFHATKVFNTFEGGAIVSQDVKTKRYIDFLKNFGIADETSVVATGINGKMSEVNAALGLLQLESIRQSISGRRYIWKTYVEQLSGVKGIICLTGDWDNGNNFGYFPISVTDEYPESRDALYSRLKLSGINCRRYFYPLISDMPMYRNFDSASPSNLPTARDVADRVLCLPIYEGLEPEYLDIICSLLRHQ